MRFSLLQVCPSAALFVFVVLFIPSFNEQRLSKKTTAKTLKEFKRCLTCKI